ncbi:MAG: ferric citrate ABC transporter ATP-binding protein FecE [Fimbriimonadales bacterium]|nr:MAG: ferric citrate ABC transporter ATP-binding protein FecE [Fimbriimonadales bacterium]
MATYNLALERVTAGYGDKPVLTEISLEVSPGEIVALVGPNGSGKTTLIRTASGVLPLMAGAIHLGETPLSDLSRKEIAQRVALVPQFENPAFDFSVRELVSMARYPWGETGMHRVEEALERLELTSLQDRPISRLSGGERQRVLLARALAQDAPILLLDEPTAHMDVQHQVQTARLLQELAQDGRTILTSLHDLNFAAACATRLVVLSNGSVALDGPLPSALESETIDVVFCERFKRVRDSFPLLFPQSLLEESKEGRTVPSHSPKPTR